MLTGPLNREFVVAAPVQHTWARLSSRARADLADVRIASSLGEARDARAEHDARCELRLRFLEEDATAPSLHCIFRASSGMRRMQVECDVSMHPVPGERTVIVVSTSLRDSSPDTDGTALLSEVLERLTEAVERTAHQPNPVESDQSTTRVISEPEGVAAPLRPAGFVAREGARAVAFLIGYAVAREILRWRSR